MPIGKFGEVIGTMNTFGEGITVNIDSKVVAPKNPKLLRRKASFLKLTPSEFLFQMSLDTHKKLQNTRTMELPEKVQLLDMADTTYQKTSQVSMEDPIFQPFPSTLYFVNCAPHETHELPLLLRNNDKVPRLVKVTHEESPYFKVIPPPNAGHKVAAGLPIVFKIQFVPDQLLDYQMDLVVVTEREKFTVPVVCIGSRAILDFPDEVTFAATPVKHKDTKTLFVRNVGNAQANFTLSTIGAFTVEPNSAVLEIDGNMQLDIHFCPMRCGNYKEELIIKYSTGESVYVNLIGAGQEVPIRLERNQVTVTETYVGLANLRQVRLHNRSDIIAHFHWSSLPSVEAERLDREACMKLLGVEEHDELSKFQQQLELTDDLSAELLSSTDKVGLVSRSFLNKKKMLSEKKLRYENEVFSIEPIEGVVWPNSSLDVTVAFRPHEARTYSSVAFCETTGRETRLSLKINGIAIGPRVEFSFRTLDIGFVFVHSRHSYELVLVNKGDIDALFRIKAGSNESVTSSAAKCFSFYPDDGLVSPGSHQAVQIRFVSDGFLGSFQEEFRVCLDGCIEPHIIRFQGTVIGPTFTFNTSKIRFGKVSLGFARTQEIIFTNTSLVPIKYRLRVPDDGEIPAITANDLDNEASPRAYYYQQKPRQFLITPSQGSIPEMSSANILIELVANHIGIINTVLIVDMIDVADEMHSLPISANVLVPEVRLSTELIDFSRCFLRYNYQKYVELINTSDLPVRYELLAQVEDRGIILYSSKTNRAIISPKSQLKVELEIIPLTIGEISTKINFKIFGSDDKQLELIVKCIGEGPVVDLDNTRLDWGTIKVLENRPLILTLSNESEIPACFSTKTIKADSVFTITPSQGVIERHEILELNVIANLNDSVKFLDELHIQIDHSKTKIVPLSATGTGTTIDFEPSIAHELDLGAHFSRANFQTKYTVINKGRRHQQLVWSNEGYSYSKAIRQAAAVKNTFAGSNPSLTEKHIIQAPMLTVHPHRFDLSPGESADLFIKGYSEIPQVVNEKIVCHAIIGKQGGKELIKKVDLKINFISPVMEYSDNILPFRIDKDIFTEFEIIRKSFILQNVSGLPINCTANLTYPFNILTNQGDKVNSLSFYLVEDEEESIVIEFDPLYKTDFCSRKVEDVMKITFDQHPHIDEIHLIGEVNFPNLEFDKTDINFDCIMNHSEVSQFVIMKNNSPLPVKYSWTILIGDKPNIIFHRRKSHEIKIGEVTHRSITAFGDYEDDEEEDSNNKEENVDEICDDNTTLEVKEVQVTEEDQVTEEFIDNENKDLDTEKETGSMSKNEIEGLVLGLSDEDEESGVKSYQERRVSQTTGSSKKKSLKSSSKRNSIKPRIDQEEVGLINENLRALLDEEKEIVTVGIEELFDVRPLFGTLGAGESEKITFTYFGHADIEAQATAICEVQGGPSYRFELYGQASEVKYELSQLDFDFGKIRYDRVSFHELIITNRGRVGFEFNAKDLAGLDTDGGLNRSGYVLVDPINGYVKSGEEAIVKIGYLPGAPGVFENTRKLQVAHFPMETVRVKGVGTFPRVDLNLPRLDSYLQVEWVDEEGLRRMEDATVELQATQRDFSVLGIYGDNLRGIPDKPLLPAYLLDFGHVILGDIISKTVRIRNNGSFTVTIKFIKKLMTQKGFSLPLMMIKALPQQNYESFEVKFDPRAANLNLGEVQSFLLINIFEGPLLPIKMVANVTMPDLRPSSDVLDFKQVCVGQASLITVQLHNPTSVTTQWTALLGNELQLLDKAKSQQIKKRSQELKPPIFEMIPNTGELRPGQKLNVQIKFMPLEEKSYSQRLVMMLAKSSKRVVIRCLGSGLEPNLKFEDGYIEFDPVLPYTGGSERSISVHNPCNFPIEFYSLEFDRVYLEEEEVLRSLAGYDKYCNLLIPPRQPSEKLPVEFTEHYEKMRCRKELEEHSPNAEKIVEDQMEFDQNEQGKKVHSTTKSVIGKSTSAGLTGRTGLTEDSDDFPLGLDEFEQTPVSQAIARYLQLDLTEEGRAARRSRGIAIVVAGSPISGKSEVAQDLARKYSAALLTVDGIVRSALTTRHSPAAQQAFRLCDDHTRKLESIDSTQDDLADKKTMGGTESAWRRSVMGVTALHNLMQARKTSSVSQVGAKHGVTGGKQSVKGNIDHAADKVNPAEGNNFVVPPSPPPFTGPPASIKLDIPVMHGEETYELMSCVLPEQKLIQIITERLMLPDCQKGVVIDGLDSVFCNNMSSCAQIVLHALNNRRFLYFVTMKRDLKQLKEEQRQDEEKERLKEEEKEKLEIQWVQEMTEEEYDSLDEVTRARIENRIREARLERKKKETEEKKRVEYELELEKQEKERLAKQKGGGKKGGPGPAPSVLGNNPDEKTPKGKSGKETSMGKTTRENTILGSNKQQDSHLTERPDSHMTDLSGGPTESDDKKRKSKILDKKSVGRIDELAVDVMEEVIVRDPKKEEERLMHQKFKTFEMEYRQIQEILAQWDRSHPPIRKLFGNGIGDEPDNPAGGINLGTTKKAGKGGASGAAGGGRKTRTEHASTGGQGGLVSSTAVASTSGASNSSPNVDEEGNEMTMTQMQPQEDPPGVCNIVVEVNRDTESTRRETAAQLTEKELPSPEEVLEGLGLGQRGPPIPPETRFNIIKYPVDRGSSQPFTGEPYSGHYVFLATEEELERLNRESLDREEEKSLDRVSISKSIRGAKSGSKEKLTNPRKPSGKKSIVGGPGNLGRRNSQIGGISAIPTPISDEDHIDEPILPQSATVFRWTVQPGKKIELKVRFKSDELGQFDQILNFEILDTRRKYQVFCRGTCAFPNISREPRIVFPNRKRNREPDEIIKKKYVLEDEIFDFGPLLIEKDKKRVMSNEYPENVEVITIRNSSPFSVDVNFCLQEDLKFERFNIEPKSMHLDKDQSQQLTVWAFPRVEDEFIDAIVCCVKENPEPVIFKLSCCGVKPSFEVDRKEIKFDKVLLHRKDMKTLNLRNSTKLPVFWQLVGLEALGDEFSFSHESGIIEPLGEFQLNAYFRTMKPFKPNQKKNFSIEAYDVDRIAGRLLHESIQIIAEAYDFALDMSFPKGSTNGLDMGVCKAGEEVHQILTLKNKGPYEIKYKFLVSSLPGKPNLKNILKLDPAQGSLTPGDKALQVQITFNSKDEIVLKEEEILKCHLIEPNVSDIGEEVAIIPIRITAKAVFSKFVITPQTDINFGAVVIHNKKTRNIILENVGEYDFKFWINRYQLPGESKSFAQKSNLTALAAQSSGIGLQNKDGVPGGPGTVASGGAVPGVIGASNNVAPLAAGAPTTKFKAMEPNMLGGTQGKLQVGNFIIYPSVGSIAPKAQFTITVDCTADNPGISDEKIVFEISDRNHKAYPQGVPYRLFVEGFVPGIDAENLGAVFEEHRIIESLSMLHKDITKFCTGGVFGKLENRFMLPNTLVGTKTEAKIRLDNPYKVPCDLSLNIRPFNSSGTSGPGSRTGGRASAGLNDIFDVDPNVGVVDPRSSLYATVYFSPQAMQQYTASFEVSIEGIPNNSLHKPKPLTFEVVGEGYLPRVSITKPRIRNKKGQPLCLFPRCLKHSHQIQNIELINDGNLPCRLHLDVIDSDDAFWVSMVDNEDGADGIKRPVSNLRQPHDLVVFMEVGQCKSIQANFHPPLVGKYTSNLKISIVNNQYEDTIIQMVGESYEDFISFENLPECPDPKPFSSSVQSTSAKSSNKESSHSSTDDKSIQEAMKNNRLYFGDCFINQSKSTSFSLVNHSEDTSVKFIFPAFNPSDSATTSPTVVPVNFCPCQGHLHPGQSINIQATFNAGATAKKYNDKVLSCKIVKITFPDLASNQNPLNWDDSKKTMVWVDATPDISATTATSSAAKKKKVVETEAEPTHVESTDPPRNIDLLVNASIDYCRYSCKLSELNFEDTMLFERRVYGFNLKNTGKINLRYCCHVRTEELDIFTSRNSSRPSTARLHSDPKNIPENEEDLLNPFMVSPKEGVIAAGTKQYIEVSFSPLSVKYHQAVLTCDIDNLDESSFPLSIHLTGRSQQPYCHMEMQDSDYLIAGRRDPSLRGPRGSPPDMGLDSATRVLEIDVVGLGSRDVKSFGVVNPTKSDYHYQWNCEDISTLKCQPAIQCVNKSGLLEAGRKVQVSFKFVSQFIGLTESFWTFEIVELNIKVPFLIVGYCIEPNVTFNKSHFKFPSLLVGQESVESVELINFDDQQYKFSFHDISRYAPGHVNHLKIEPMSGILSSKARMNVIIGFRANSTQKLNFNVLCQVDKKSYPLTLNVKAEGYSIESSVWLEDDDGHSFEVQSMPSSIEPTQDNIQTFITDSTSVQLDEWTGGHLNFGKIELNEQQRRWITIINGGKFDFEFQWVTKMLEASTIIDLLEIEPVYGKILVGEKMRCELVLNAEKQMNFSNEKLMLCIKHGTSYLLSLGGEVKAPVLDLSFTKYDFGHSFIFRDGMEPLHARLILENKEKHRDLSVEYIPSKSAMEGELSCIHHDLSSCVVPANGGRVAVNVDFVPQRVGRYSEKLVMEINGNVQRTVEFVGLCEELRIQPMDLRGSTLNLGAVRSGECVQKTLHIVNRSHASVTGCLAFTAENPELADHGGLKIHNLGQVFTLAPGSNNAIPISLTFNPTGRIPKFTEKVYLTTMGISVLIFIVTGSCHGHDIQLDMESISFGLVTKGSQLSRRLLLMNLGDIGARFSWDIKTFKPNFSITPTKGYISPGMKVPFDVTFHPIEPHRDIRNEKLRCSIEGWIDIPLILTGVCQDINPVKDVVSFTSTVRQIDIKSIKIHNSTNAPWSLRPVFVGEHWTGAETLYLEPQQIRQYEITFRPLVMTVDGKKHQGSVFFAIPDGSGLLFNLTGTAEPPKAIARITHDLPARTSYTELLDVTGWLRRPQKFKVTREILKPEKSDCGASLKGFDFVEVAAGSNKKYKLTFVAQKEGITQAKITFTDEEYNGEYFYYELVIRTTKPTSTALIKLTSPVRQSLQHELTLENPSKSDTNFQLNCSCSEIQCMNQVAVSAQSKLKVTLEFLPLKVGESQGKLEIISPELGSTVYDLELTGTTPKPEKHLVFSTALGTSQSLLTKVRNFTRNKVDFSCKIDGGVNKFSCDKSLPVAPSVDAQLEVHFEPNKLGETRTTLCISNSNAGEFIFPLVGTATMPKPQGPFTIKSGGTVSITVRNFLSEPAQFLFSVDNSAFHLTKNSETIRGRRDHRVVVGYDGASSQDGGPVMGKLVVTCPAEMGCDLQWVYYLRGIAKD